jgi:hypothetical protein
MLLQDNPEVDDAETLQEAIRIMLKRFSSSGWKVRGLVLFQDELDNAIAENRVGDTLMTCLFPDPTKLLDAREMPLFDGIRIKMGEGDMPSSVFVVTRAETGQMNAEKRLYPFDAELYGDVAN